MIDDLLDRYAAPSRREFLKTSGRLVVGIAAATQALLPQRNLLRA